MLVLTTQNAAEMLELKLPLVNPKHSEIRRATNAMIAPYSVIPCPFRFRPFPRLRVFLIVIIASATTTGLVDPGGE